MTVMKHKANFVAILVAATITLMACEPENQYQTSSNSVPSEPTLPTTAELLVGRWQQTSMDGQTLPSFLIAIDEYRSDGMFVSSVENTSTGVYFADSSRFTVTGDSIFYEVDGWGADEIIHLDSLRLEKRSYISDYNVTSTCGYVRL